METDLGKITLIIGSANLILSSEVAIILNIFYATGMGFIPPAIMYFFFMLSYVQIFVILMFGVAGIRRNSSKGKAVIGIFLGLIGTVILGVFYVI